MFSKQTKKILGVLADVITKIYLADYDVADYGIISCP